MPRPMKTTADCLMRGDRLWVVTREQPAGKYVTIDKVQKAIRAVPGGLADAFIVTAGVEVFAYGPTDQVGVELPDLPIVGGQGQQ